MCVCVGGGIYFYCRSGRITQVTLATSKRSEIRRTAEKSHACILQYKSMAMKAEGDILNVFNHVKESMGSLMVLEVDGSHLVVHFSPC